MKAEKRANIIMQELDGKAASIPGYLEDDYRAAILKGLKRIAKMEAREAETNSAALPSGPFGPSQNEEKNEEEQLLNECMGGVAQITCTINKGKEAMSATGPAPLLLLLVCAIVKSLALEEQNKFGRDPRDYVDFIREQVKSELDAGGANND